MINSQLNLQISEDNLQQKPTTTDLLSFLKPALQKAKCTGNNKVIFFCCYQNCQKIPTICGVQTCQCKSDHMNCFQVFQSSLFQKAIDEKTNQQGKLKDQIQVIFDKIIDQIYNVKNQVISSLKNIFFRDQQKKFVKSIVNSQVNNIQSKNLSNLIPHLSGKFHQQNQLLKNLLLNMCKKFQQESRNSFSNFLTQIMQITYTHEIKPFNANFCEIKDKSLIITHKHEIFTLKSFMPKGKFDKLKLLYRASQHDFQIKVFYQKCNVQRTLILIKTQKDKIIGGYTPIPWRLTTQFAQDIDPSGQTFIFSLTNKDKFIMKDKNKATYIHDQKGLRFGEIKYPDLGIGDKANKSMDGNIIFYKMNFSNPKYTNSKQSYKSFTGFDTDKYLIKEWQVYQVIF